MTALPARPASAPAQTPQVLLLVQSALLLVLPSGGQRSARRNALAGIGHVAAARRRPDAPWQGTTS